MTYKRAYALLLFLLLTLVGYSQNSEGSSTHSVFITGLLATLLLLTALAAVYFFSKYTALKKEEEKQALTILTLKTDLEVNRALLNPHFIFNALSALQNSILTKDHELANSHLVKFSKLIRKLLESNISNVISLELELAMIKSYLQFKDVTVKEQIHDSLEVDPSIILADTYIPVMMVQPFIENAIFHGLLKKTGEKTLSVAYTLMDNQYILCSIEDNGIGRKKANEKLLEKKATSTAFIRQRLDLLNRTHKLNCTLVVEDKVPGEGTTVKIKLPILKNA